MLANLLPPLINDNDISSWDEDDASPEKILTLENKSPEERTLKLNMKTFVCHF